MRRNERPDFGSRRARARCRAARLSKPLPQRPRSARV